MEDIIKLFSESEYINRDDLASIVIFADASGSIQTTDDEPMFDFNTIEELITELKEKQV